MKLEILRKEKGLTEVQLAELAGSKRRTLQEFKKSGDCKVSTAIKYAIALDVTLDYLFSEEIKEEKKKREEGKEMIKVKRKGMGAGKGTMVDVLSRKVIEGIIEGLHQSDVIECALKAYNHGFKTGYATINLVTGKLESLGLGTNEENQATDNTYITLFRVDQNAEFLSEGILSEEEIEEGKELTEKDIKEYLDYHFDWNWEAIYRELDDWYGEVNQDIKN